jgi:arginase family enzyme
MEQAAATGLPYPEALVVALDSLDEQSDAIARGLPQRPLVLGGCCCAHVGAIRGLATRNDRLAVVWLGAR